MTPGLKFISTRSSSSKNSTTPSSKSCLPLPFRFQVEFSKPLQTKPIPEGTVKVFFDVIALEAASDSESSYEVEFNFENESLKHKLSNTMRKNMFEVSAPTVTGDSNGSTECWKTN